jgi:5-methylcytosine-specific restriction protein A
VPKPLERRQRFREHEPNRIRGRKGMALRQRRLANEPLCRDCGDKGVVRASTVPDHIVPLALGGSDTDDNIRCLCATCHRIRTAEQFGYRNPISDVDPDGWPKS